MFDDDDDGDAEEVDKSRQRAGLYMHSWPM